MRTLAKTDPIADDFMRLLDAAIASGRDIHSNDADLVAGMSYLATKPVEGAVLTEQRKAEILGG